MNIYQFSDYRDCIEALLQEKLGRGGKTRLAQELNCQPGYVSQVLNKSKIHFSAENVHQICKFFSLSHQEEDFLLTLLHFERAGSQELKKFYLSKIDKFKRENLKVEKQIKDVNRELDEATKAVYYSHWAYSAVHMLVSIEKFQRAETIAARLKLSMPFAEKILSFLEEHTLIVKEKGNRYAVGKTRIHLGKDSPLLKAHHQNYRHKAIISLEEENDFDLHYSGVLTLGKKDALKIRALVLKLISDNEEILIPSPNEEMVCLNVDLFKL